MRTPLELVVSIYLGLTTEALVVLGIFFFALRNSLKDYQDIGLGDVLQETFDKKCYLSF